MSLLSQTPTTYTPGVDNAQTFGNQDATIIDAKPTKSSQFFETIYGTNPPQPKVDANGNKIPKWDWCVTFKGDDGKVAKKYVSGITAPDANGHHDLKPKSNIRAFLAQLCAFTKRDPETLNALSDVIGWRVRVMGVPPQGNQKRWQLLLVGPAQVAVAPAAATPNVAAPSAPVAASQPALNGSELWAQIPDVFQAQIVTALKTGSVQPAQLVSSINQFTPLKTEAEANAAIGYAKTLGA